jgi:hypothetical protein
MLAELFFQHCHRHSKPTISLARQPVARAKRTMAAKCGGHAATSFAASSLVYLTTQQPNLRNHVDPLPLIACHTQQAAHQRQVSIDGRGHVAFRLLVFDHLADHIAIDLVEHQFPEHGVKLPANAPHVFNAPQIRLQCEVPNNRFLP